MRIIALIPARWGSKRIEHKAMRECNGQPLVAWTIDAALMSSRLAGVWVTTDADSIALCAANMGAAVIRRPAELCTDDAPIEPTISHASATLATIHDHWDAMLLLQPTSPLRGTYRIDQACDMIEAGAESVVGVTRFPLAHFTGVIDGEGHWVPRYADRPRTQDIDLCRENGSLWGFTRASWDDTHSRLGRTPKALVMDDWESIDVDAEWDLRIAEDELRLRGRKVQRSRSR